MDESWTVKKAEHRRIDVFEIIYAAVSVVHSFSILNSVLLEEHTMVCLSFLLLVNI